MDESKIQKAPQKPEEQEIDLIELAQKVWAERKMLYKVCGIAAVIGLIVGFSIPKEHSTEVTLAPESASKVNAGSMGALAAMPCRPSCIPISLSQPLFCWSCLM